MVGLLDKQDLDHTMKQVALKHNLKYDGQMIKKGSKKIRIQLLKNGVITSNYNKYKRTLYVSKYDVDNFRKLKLLVSEI